jgi:UDP-N-acetylglucosamine 2-epimerase (non-hydrolysing)
MAATLTAAKLNIPVAHVEAGLRSFDRTMPEEVNRVVTDALSTILFTTSREAETNLSREGLPRERIFFVGNVMIDTLLRCRRLTEDGRLLEQIGAEKGRYVLVTLHRPSNVDVPEVLNGLVGALLEIAASTPVFYPVHPRTATRLREHGLEQRLRSNKNVTLLPALGYLDFLVLEANAAVVVTDSGGVQEETTVLGVPCLTLRENTERPVTVEQGTNRLVGRDPGRIVTETNRCLSGERGRQIPELWDGHAAERIVGVLRDVLVQ